MNPTVKAFIDLQVELVEAGLDVPDEAIATLVASAELREALVNELADICTILRER
jgi:hypothetical protein